MAEMAEEIGEVLGSPMVDPSTRQKVGQSENNGVILEQVEGVAILPDWKSPSLRKCVHEKQLFGCSTVLRGPRSMW